ncbi:cell division protein FtsI (penicillin-binding protein 3) [Chitinophaga skermanii]|uniref:Cell division protein FtsI (Penicillin-binding protein 3) n=1 Tax=Chitinophaga skermanii TaxID=331697 RepID=A0A327Q3H2_9BACT|nr:penicillin-binding protein [Chitinophaga skermanii]RAI98464.1 cell division protein FtsI (penicillin-binding protein 3) [Chitinophaga skermanii]
MVIFAVAILAKVFVIQNVQGAKWKSFADSLQTQYVTLDADRGTIYSEEGRMLSTSVPYFDIRIDFAADGLRKDNGKIFTDNLDSLSIALAGLFQDKSVNAYKTLLKEGYKSRDRYFLLKRNINFSQFQALREFPMFKLGRNKGGLIAETKNKRINPFKLLANRTIGLARDNAQNVGLENTYDSDLRGVTGKRLMRRIAGGTYVPMDGYDIEPENGKDIVTTLDVNMQDIVETALMRMMIQNECEHGACILMEVKTGKIKAIANLGRQPDGSYTEDYNYALQAGEPGSTFKLATMIALLEDKYITPEDQVDLNYGSWKVGKRTVYDSEPHHLTNVTIKHAFERSSNVAMAKLVQQYYKGQPNAFVKHLQALRLDSVTGIDLKGEGRPVIKNTASKTWSATSLPWMAFGYEVLQSPLQTAMLYNAVANNGKMMRPYLVNSVMEFGEPIKTFSPQVVMDSICSQHTLKQIKSMLEGVMISGTGRALFSPYYKIAGKTGTALVADQHRGYAAKIYQSSFAGYFPADDPQYTCVVVIKNKSHAAKIYGATVAGPVFREVSDKLFAIAVDKHKPMEGTAQIDTLLAVKSGKGSDWRSIVNTLQLPWKGTLTNNNWVDASINEQKFAFQPLVQPGGTTVPNVKGMGLKDALYLLENAGLRVVIKGAGKVVTQSLPGGTAIGNDKTIVIELS